MSALMRTRRVLPNHPSREHLRKQAKRLSRDQSLCLAAAQRRLAVDYGVATWAKRMRVVDAAQPLSPLAAAAKAGNVAAVRRLLREGANPDGAPNDRGQPLWQACESDAPAVARLAIVVPIALAMIFLLLYLTFGSMRQSILVFCNVPFACIGGIVALRLSGEFLSVPASVGFIALLGIAVLNGVVMVTYINDVLINYLNEQRGNNTGPAPIPAKPLGTVQQAEGTLCLATRRGGPDDDKERL